MHRDDPTGDDYISKERKAQSNGEELRFWRCIRGNAGKDKGSGSGESKTRDDRSDVDLPFEAAFAGG